MVRRILVACFAAVGALHYLIVGAGAWPNQDGNPNSDTGNDIYVKLTARLHEVDEAFHNDLAKARWRTRADLEELENKPQADSSLFTRLAKQKLFLAGKEIRIDPGKEGVLLTATRPTNFLPTPDQLQQGKKGPQTIHEGVTLSAQVHISADRRFVLAKVQEKSLEIEGTEKVTVVVDLTEGTEAVGEIVFAAEASFSQARYIPDGGSILILLHTRPLAVRNASRWLVAEITPRIHIEEEERERRLPAPE
jgi:hypothetical protein